MKISQQELKYQIAIQTGVVAMVSNPWHEHRDNYWDEKTKLQELQAQLEETA